MRIWLVQTGEELPIDPGPPRLWRTCLVAQELATRGHDVVYWSSSYNHQKKMQRTECNERVEGPGYAIQFLFGRAYKSSISIDRIRSQIDNARAFDALAAHENPPDVILCGFPTIELADSVARFAVDHRIPFALDSRDMWPDIFSPHIPMPIRPLAWPLFAYWKAMRKRAYVRAAALTGITDDFVRWGLDIAGRASAPLDQSFHLSIAKNLAPDAVESADRYWDAVLGPKCPDTLTLCFAGTMSARQDLHTLVEATKQLPSSHGAAVQLVLCGDGDEHAALLDAARDRPNIHLPGWVDAARLHALMERSDFGILPYPNTADFQASYPNKVGEYLGAGLPIITGLGGVTRALLEKNEIELRYEVGNVSSLRATIIRAADRAAYWRSRKNRAIETFRQHFDPDTIYPAFADWIEMIAAKGPFRL